MNLTLRARIFIISSVVILVILAISIFLMVISKERNMPEDIVLENQIETEQMQYEKQIINSSIQPTVIDSNLLIKPLTAEEKMKEVANNMAKIFVERYGSYSTDNSGQNLKDLEILSTPDLWKVLENRLKTMSDSKEFIGVTTQAFSSSILSYEKNKVVVNVITSREENKNGILRNFNQEAEVTLLKNGDGWLVDDIKWK